MFIVQATEEGKRAVPIRSLSVLSCHWLALHSRQTLRKPKTETVTRVVPLDESDELSGFSGSAADAESVRIPDLLSGFPVNLGPML